MPENTVQISLEVVKKGFENIQELSAKLQQAQSQTDEYKQKIKSLEEEHEKHTGVLLQARKAIHDFHKEMFAVTFIIGTVTAGLVGLSKNSENLSASLDKVGSVGRDALNSLGNFVDSLIQRYNVFFNLVLHGVSNLQAAKSAIGNPAPVNRNITSGTAAEIESITGKTAGLRGDTALSHELALDVEFLQKIQPLLEKTKGSIAQDQLARAWRDYRDAADDALRRSELGLKNNLEIAKQFSKEIADAFEHLASDPIFKFLQGEKQGFADIAKGFQTNVNQALANAIGSAFKSALFGGGGFSFESFFSNIKDTLSGKDHTTSAVKEVKSAVDRNTQILALARDCICRTAENTGLMASRGGGIGGLNLTGEIIPPGKSALSTIGSIAGAIGGLAGSFSKGGLPSGANIVSAVPSLKFAGGGEVPAYVTPGEFVVRKDVAQANMPMLKSLNKNGNLKSAGGGGNVFVIKANDANSFIENLQTPDARATMEMQVIRALMGNGNIRRVIQSYT